MPTVRSVLFRQSDETTRIFSLIFMFLIYIIRNNDHIIIPMQHAAHHISQLYPFFPQSLRAITNRRSEYLSCFSPKYFNQQYGYRVAHTCVRIISVKSLQCMRLASGDLHQPDFRFENNARIVFKQLMEQSPVSMT